MVPGELTKKFEEHVGNDINNVIEFFKDKDIIGEITIVIKEIRKTDFNLINQLLKDLNDLITAKPKFVSSIKILGEEK